VAVARQRLRRRRAATALLLVLTGVAAAVPLALWTASRQTVTAFDRFVDRAEVPDRNLIICPPDHQLAEGPEACFTRDVAEDVRTMRGLPGVAAAATFGFHQALVDTGRDGAGEQPAGLGVSTVGAGAATPTYAGDPIVLDGRVPDEAAADELMVTDAAARSLGLAVGDRVRLRGVPLGTGSPPGTATSTVVGVVRTPAELLPVTFESAGGPAFHARAGWVAAHGAAIPGFSAGVVWLEDGDVRAFRDRLREALPDQEVVDQPVVPDDEADTIEHATSLEGRAGLALAATAALGAVFFVGQAVSRQSRAEAADREILRALGLTRGQLAAVPTLRWLPVAAGGALLAVVLAWAASALGPIGVARRGMWDRSPHVDWLVLSVGAAATAGLVLVIAAVGGVFRTATSSSTGTTPQAAAVGPPGLRTGIGLAWASVRRGAALPLVSAVLATALAMAGIIAAAGGATSLRLVTDEPDRFGAPWDAKVSGGGGFDTPEEAVTALSELPGLASVAGIAGTDVRIEDERLVWVQALHRVGDLPMTDPVIVSGRAPSTDREIALGSVTREQTGAAVGADVTVTGEGSEPLVYRVVGVAMVTDGAEPNVGQGALVTPEGLARVEPSAGEELELGVDVVEGPRGEQALQELREVFSATTIPFPVPSSLANAERIADLPLFLAGGGALLAAITFAHALIVSVRRNRRELAVCRVIGFTRGQVRNAVTTQAVLLALVAVIVGLPLGVAGARWGWRTMARAFGVSTGPLVPAWVVAACAAVTVVLAVAAAAPSSGWTTRRRPAEALRAE
jgi:putative ABC transport system permease protein